MPAWLMSTRAGVTVTPQWLALVEAIDAAIERALAKEQLKSFADLPDEIKAFYIDRAEREVQGTPVHTAFLEALGSVMDTHVARVVRRRMAVDAATTEAASRTKTALTMEAVTECTAALLKDKRDQQEMLRVLLGEEMPRTLRTEVWRIFLADAKARRQYEELWERDRTATVSHRYAEITRRCQSVLDHSYRDVRDRPALVTAMRTALSYRDTLDLPEEPEAYNLMVPLVAVLGATFEGAGSRIVEAALAFFDRPRPSMPAPPPKRPATAGAVSVVSTGSGRGDEDAARAERMSVAKAEAIRAVREATAAAFRVAFDEGDHDLLLHIWKLLDGEIVQRSDETPTARGGTSMSRRGSAATARSVAFAGVPDSPGAAKANGTSTTRPGSVASSKRSVKSGGSRKSARSAASTALGTEASGSGDDSDGDDGSEDEASAGFQRPTTLLDPTVPETAGSVAPTPRPVSAVPPIPRAKTPKTPVFDVVPSPESEIRLAELFAPQLNRLLVGSLSFEALLYAWDQAVFVGFDLIIPRMLTVVLHILRRELLNTTSPEAVLRIFKERAHHVQVDELQAAFDALYMRSLRSRLGIDVEGYQRDAAPPFPAPLDKFLADPPPEQATQETQTTGIKWEAPPEDIVHDALAQRADMVAPTLQRQGSGGGWLEAAGVAADEAEDEGPPTVESAATSTAPPTPEASPPPSVQKSPARRRVPRTPVVRGRRRRSSFAAAVEKVEKIAAAEKPPTPPTPQPPTPEKPPTPAPAEEEEEKKPHEGNQWARVHTRYRRTPKTGRRVVGEPGRVLAEGPIIMPPLVVPIIDEDGAQKGEVELNWPPLYPQYDRVADVADRMFVKNRPVVVAVPRELRALFREQLLIEIHQACRWLTGRPTDVTFKQTVELPDGREYMMILPLLIPGVNAENLVRHNLRALNVIHTEEDVKELARMLADYTRQTTGYEEKPEKPKEKDAAVKMTSRILKAFAAIMVGNNRELQEIQRLTEQEKIAHRVILSAAQRSVFSKTYTDDEVKNLKGKELKAYLKRQKKLTAAFEKIKKEQRG